MSDKKKQSAPNRKSAASSWIVPAVMALVVAGIFVWVRQQPVQTAPSTSAPGGVLPAAGPVASMVPEDTGDTIPSYFASAEAAKPYPTTLSPEQFPIPVVAHAYRVAQEMPGVLAQQPCYCFCYKTAGHRGLLDCYADLHGSSCSVCVQEALLTEKLTKEGRSPSQIREAIIRGDWRTVELN
jgi:Protein of unknown function with PCYCGC motif